MRIRSALRSLGFVVLMVAAGCTDKPSPLDPGNDPGPDPDPDTGTVSFEEDIEPLFRRYLCLNCHSNPANSNFSVASYALFLTPGDQATVRGLLPIKARGSGFELRALEAGGAGPPGGGRSWALGCPRGAECRMPIRRSSAPGSPKVPWTTSS